MIFWIIKKLFKLVVYLVFVGVLIVYLPKFLSYVLHTPYPLATITSGSMWPVLKENDLVLMQGATGSDVAVGDIIVFRNPKGFTIHRLIEKADGKLITKGDANSVEDSPIGGEDVIGKVVVIRGQLARIPYVGFVARSLGPKIQEINVKFKNQSEK